MKLLFSRFYVNFTIEKHSKNNRNLVPVKVPVKSKHGIYIATRYVNPNKNTTNLKSTKENDNNNINKDINKELKTNIDTIRNQLIENYNKIYNDVANDLEYLSKIGYDIANENERKEFIRIYNSNIRDIADFFRKYGERKNAHVVLEKAKKYEKADKIVKTILGLAFITSGVKEFIPEWKGKSLKEMFEDMETLSKIKAILYKETSSQSDLFLSYALIFNKNEVTISEIINIKGEIDEEFDKNKNHIEISNELVASNSNRSINSENILMRQLAFAEYLKEKLNFNNYEISAEAVSSEWNGLIGAGVWLKRGYSIDKNDLQYLYEKLVNDYEYILDFSELEKLINYMIENDIVDATKDFKTFNKFLHFEFMLNSEENKKDLLEVLKEKENVARRYISNSMRKNKYIKLLKYIQSKIKNENKIGLFDLLKISDTRYSAFIRNKETFFTNLLASKIRLDS